MKTVGLTIVIGGLLAVAGQLIYQVSIATALPQFKKEFDDRYIGEETTERQRSISARVQEARCNVCHDPKKDDQGRESKTNRNPYGVALAQFLTQDDRQNVEKIHRALEQVETMKAAPNGKTFGELLQAGELPHSFDAVDVVQ